MSTPPVARMRRHGDDAIATPANLVTIARLILAVPTLLLIIDQGSSWLTVSLWFVLTTTDGLDGWLARRDGTTRSGAFLDPLADKFLVLGAMAALVAKGVLWWVPVGIIAVRELALSCYRSYVGRRGVSVPARFQAKVKTWMQAVAVGLYIAPVSGDVYKGFRAGVLWSAVGLTVVTGVQYLWDGRQVIREM